MQVFEYVVVRVTRHRDLTETEATGPLANIVKEVLDGPTTIVAHSKEDARDRALVAVARKDVTANMSDKDVLVRPFCR